VGRKPTELVSLAALVAAEPLLADHNPAVRGTPQAFLHLKALMAATVLRAVGDQRVAVVAALLLRGQLLLSALVVLAVLVQLLALAARRSLTQVAAVAGRKPQPPLAFMVRVARVAAVTPRLLVEPLVLRTLAVAAAVESTALLLAAQAALASLF